MQPQGSAFLYLVHYDGWNKKYDELVSDDRLLVINDVSTAEHDKLKDAAKASAPAQRPDRKRKDSRGPGEKGRKADGSEDEDTGTEKGKVRKVEAEPVRGRGDDLGASRISRAHAGSWRRRPHSSAPLFACCRSRWKATSPCTSRSPSRSSWWKIRS